MGDMREKEKKLIFFCHKEKYNRSTKKGFTASG
jgi:hypothetical protein